MVAAMFKVISDCQGQCAQTEGNPTMQETSYKKKSPKVIKYNIKRISNMTFENYACCVANVEDVF